MESKKTEVRWHPLFIRWCLNIMLMSSKTYQVIRESGFICLPSQRTLKDYTQWTKLQPGFNADMFNHLMEEAKVDQMESWERLDISCPVYKYSSVMYAYVQVYCFSDR